MKNIKNKVAFTIAEAIICFIIMGLMFIATISNVGRNDHYDKLYWQAFDTLYQAAKTASEEFEKNHSYKDEWYNENDPRHKDQWAADGTPNIKRVYPGFLRQTEYAGNDDRAFCKMLIKYINTLNPGSECESGTFKANDIIKNGKGARGVNFYTGYSLMKDGSTEESMENIEPSFRSLNGQKFFISPLLTANFIITGEENKPYNVKRRESYRFVVVDLNGDSKPNTQFIKSGRYPDLVLFAINAQGNVIPLGLPEFSKTYISAQVFYPTDVKNDGTSLYEKIHSAVETLWNAKKRAWGGNEGKGCSVDNGMIFMQNISDYEPLSQSVKFYYNAINCIENKDSATACANRKATINDNYVDEEYVYLVNQFLYKEEDSFERYEYLEEGECDKHTLLDKENGCINIKESGDENVPAIPKCGIDFKH